MDGEMERSIERVARKHKVDVRTVRLLAGMGVGIDYTPSQNTRKPRQAPQTGRRTRDFDLV